MIRCNLGGCFTGFRAMPEFAAILALPLAALLCCDRGGITDELRTGRGAMARLAALGTLLLRFSDDLLINLDRRFLIKVLRSILTGPCAADLGTRDNTNAFQHFENIDLVALSIEDV